MNLGRNNNKVYRLVLTGGPCGGKTTGQARLSSFFENLGWKVYRVPETATILMSGGIKFRTLNEEEVYKFQENLLKTMLQVEDTFLDLASSCSNDCLVICDRGAMDATAYMQPGQWEQIKETNSWNEVELRDGRYNQVIHMVSAAKGAEAFYHVEDHVTRDEGMDQARHLDDMTSQAWVGHPYYDVIDNSTDFERKANRMIAAVCNRLNIDVGDRLELDSKKRKFLVVRLPDNASFPQFQDFTVVHDYLATPNQKMQARVRRRGKNGFCTYVHTIRRPEIKDQSPEVKMQINFKEYELLLAQRDTNHGSICKTRRCFLWNNQYFQLDIYQQPCEGLLLLETFTTLGGDDLHLPDFLEIREEVTGNPKYSMYNLSAKEPATTGKEVDYAKPDIIMNGIH